MSGVELSLKLLALQSERDYLLFRMRDLEQKEGSGFHPSTERRQVMAYFEAVNSEVQTLIRSLLVREPEDEKEKQQ